MANSPKNATGKTTLATKQIVAQVHGAPSKNTIILMSPAVASFDTFKNVYDRGKQFQAIVKILNDSMSTGV